MAYFTILHWIVAVILSVLLVLFSLIALKQNGKKVIITILVINFIVISMLFVLSILILDKYTKKAQLENIVQKRILRTERLTLSGRVRNIGNFDIGKCSLEIKLVNNPMQSGSAKGSQVFTPSGFSFFSFSKKNTQPSTVINKFVIAKNLRSKELRNFSVSMRYPPYFKKPYMDYELYCH